MKRTSLILGAFLSSCIMISVVTAVPQTNSKPVMDVIKEIEERTNIVNEKVLDVVPDPNGIIIDLIKQLISLIIQFILNLIDMVMDLIGIVNLIEYLIYLIGVLIAAIMALIDAILNLFNPQIAIS